VPFDTQLHAVIVEKGEHAQDVFSPERYDLAVASKRWLIYAGLVYVIFCWALNTVILKYAFGAFDPLALTGLRFIAMTPLAFLLAKLRGERIYIYRRDLPLLILCGACGYGAYQYLWVLGLAHTTPFASSLLGSLAPIMTLAVVAALGQERVRSGRWVGAAVALFGVAIFEGAFAGHATFRIGDALTLVSTALFALFNVFSARVLDRYTPISFVAITMTIGTMMILPGALPRLVHQDFSHIPPVDWAIYAYAVLFPILLTYPVWSYGISQLGAARTSLFQFGTPVLAGLLSVMLLRARIEPHQIIGAGICIAGMALSQAIGKQSLFALWAQRTQGMER
jgi:drug/metabolite transporter (DMT)-like permease